ncbi:hypothetical protein [Butyrivibrio sp. AE3004]|uniref:hypothetical protein n=1 Tax=Butyrivibrio sp. AE3004 TaxID=1506994 RepID=UPI000494A5A9|nr:hypothetical protein [Butyrivibrio sp. AE3004]
MEYTYTPKRLLQAVEDIKIQHPLEQEIPQISQDQSLFELITRLAKLELYQVKVNAIALSDLDAARVAGYLPFNYYNVNMKNLFLIFNYRSNDRLCKILFNQWQDSFYNRDCNAFITELLNMDEKFIMMIRGCHYKEDEFSKALEGNHIILLLIKKLKSTPFPVGTELGEKLQYWGIRTDSKLFRAIKFLFYTFCEKEDYLAITKGELLSTVRRYAEKDQEVLKKFLINFISKFEHRELENYPELASFLVTQTGEVNTDKFKNFFEGVDYSIVKKYINWINIKIINEVFGYDERSRFWKQYEYLSVRKYYRSNSVVMEMEKYYAVEFLGKAMGPIYIYKKEVFDSQVRKWFVYNNNSEVRSLLFNNQDLCVLRRAHNSGWEREINRYLISNHMTQKIVV